MLRDIGVKIALDDFGTGFSSLNYLRAFPFDKIKIDRCFVTDLAKRDDCRAIVSAVLTLAKSLGMRTTVEGIECVEQVEILQELGCDEMQGFLFSKPINGKLLPRKNEVAEEFSDVYVKLQSVGSRYLLSKAA
jgi:EAL domain-containing protein (putative c-di-GMP-specific phosphodiesterase class I)